MRIRETFCRRTASGSCNEDRCSCWKEQGIAYVAILLLLSFITILGLAFVYKASLEATAALVRSDHMSAEYLAEAGANHAVWRLLNERGFPARSDVYYMHDLGNGRYGYKVRPHTDTTFATIAAVGATSRNVVKQNYVVYVKRQMASILDASFVLSTAASAVLGGLSFDRMDLVDYEYGTDSATLFEDGTALFSASKNVDAMSIMSKAILLPGGVGDYPGAVNALGPVGYWRLDESSGTTASDETGSNDGTVTGMSPNWVAGKVDGALQFSGANGRIAGVGSCPAGSFTVACWAIDTGGGGWKVLYSAGQEVWFGVDSGASAALWVDVGGNGHGANMAAGTWSQNVWHHVACTWDGTNVHLYLDGVDSGISTYGNPNNPTATAAEIGAYSTDSNSENWFGIMDEVSVFDYALSDGDVEHLYNEGMGYFLFGDAGYIVMSTGTAATIDTLSFDESDLVAYDPVGGTAEVILDGSVAFTGTENIDAVHMLDNGHIVLSTSRDAVLGGLPFRREDLVEYDPIGDSATYYLEWEAHFPDSDPPNLNAAYVLTDDQIVFSISDTTATIGALTFGNEDLVVYDPGTTTTRMFFDGGVPFGDLGENITAVHVTIGNYPDVINGLNPVGYWRLGDGSGTTAVDETGNKNGRYKHGVSLGEEGAIAGDSDTAVEFDGSDDKIEVGSSGLFPVNGDISVNIWVNIDRYPSGSGRDLIFSLESKNNNKKMNTFELRVNDSGDLYYRHQYDNEGDLEETALFNSVDLNEDTWYNLTITRDAGSNEVSVYINGVFLEAATYSNAPEGEVNAKIFVGRQSGAKFDGFMDELALFDYVLSDTEALSIYKAGI